MLILFKKVYILIIYDYKWGATNEEDYKNNFMLSSRDSIIIYNFIKRNYKFILNGDESSFKDLEQQLDKDLYKKIKELYIYYKSKLT